MTAIQELESYLNYLTGREETLHTEIEERRNRLSELFNIRNNYEIMLGRIRATMKAEEEKGVAALCGLSKK